MRIPFTKPWRAFEEFDSMSDEECLRYVRDAFINRQWMTVRTPLCIGLAVLVAWPAAWATADLLLPVRTYVPLPASLEGMAVFYVVSTPLAVFLAWALSRDLGVYLGLRAEIRRSCCPKCGQSLTGVPIQSVGVDPDPSRHFVRCPECGRKHNLLELGLTPRDLVPFEQRGVPVNFGQKRPSSSWRAGS